jgi:hypothetical protein
MSAIVAERFNPKWNRAIATPFLTNSFQQDYPQIGLVDIGWGEDVDKVDINNTSFPKPTNVPVMMRWVRQLSRTSLALYPVNQICWMYNKDMIYGAWPGNGVTFHPQLTAGPVLQNPLMSMIDANGNRMIVTSVGKTVASPAPAAVAPRFGQIQLGGLVSLFVLGAAPPAWFVTGVNLTVAVSDGRMNSPATSPVTVASIATGVVIGGQTYWGFAFVLPGAPVVTQVAITGTAVEYVGAPLLPPNAAEGATFTDGTVVWTVVSGESQGFRVSPLPGANGPVYEITAYYQMLLQKMTTLQSLINPIPDDQSYIFQTGVEWMCKMSSPNPGDRAEGMKNWPLWLKSLTDLLKQNDREVDAYSAVPACSPVETVYGGSGGLRNPQDPGQPY